LKVERLFSSTGKMVNGDRNRLSADSLESEVLLTVNRRFVDGLIDNV
jgi:hypothetical protein